MRRSPLKNQGEQHVVEIIHFADPWCFWSWGFEPILQRLKEVYGDQIKVAYKMGGITNNIHEWRKEYDVAEDGALGSWISDSTSMTKMPTNPDYYVKTKVDTTWPACIAVKAAQMQNEKQAEHLLRRLIEVIQVEAKNGNKEEVYLPLAKEVGLDTDQLKKDIKSGKPEKLFKEDMKAMNVNFLTLVLVNKKNGKKKAIGEVFTSDKYEQAVESITEGKLRKNIPVDILAYFERHRGNIVPAKEIAEVFQITEEDAERRLNILAKGTLLEKKSFEFEGIFWKSTDTSGKAKALTLEQLNASHVTETAKVAEADAGKIITKAVKNLYTEVATNPSKAYHFPLGRKAALLVGYPEEELNKIPETAVESFAGVGYPHRSNSIKPGSKVLDIGSGSGTDILVASLRTGSEGSVTGLDITDAMIEKARSNIAKMGAKNVKIVKGDASKIPLENDSIDVATSNGVLNLVPEKKKAFQEIYRVLKPGGRIQIADIVVQKDVQKVCGLIPQLWADCIGGAAVEGNYLKLIKDTGFKDVEIIKRLDYFSGSSSDNTKRLTRTFGAESVVITGIKPH